MSSSLVVMFILALFIGISLYIIKFQQQSPYFWINTNSSNKCTIDTCGAIDPVNDPDYNMRNVIKQSILLEEHLAEKNKYCKACIVKHFQHIIGLCEEAIWLAGPSVNTYPFLSESPNYYQSIFDAWLKKQDDDKYKLHVLSLLRDRRRLLIQSYYLS